MSNWWRNHLIPVTATLGVVACALADSGAGTAAAGTNGQHINYHSRNARGQCTTGTNQNGQIVQNCTLLHAGENPDHDYWWVGTVNINWYDTDDRYVSSTCDVPKSNDNGDFIDCSEPS